MAMVPSQEVLMGNIDGFWATQSTCRDEQRNEWSRLKTDRSWDKNFLLILQRKSMNTNIEVYEKKDSGAKLSMLKECNETYKHCIGSL